MGNDLQKVLLTEEEILARIEEMAADIWRDYAGKDLLLVGVLKGAILVMADLMRALPGTVPMDWMAISSYGSGTKSSGVVRIIKDLDTDITGRHVLIVEDIIDSGLTLSWIRSNLQSRSPASVEICTLLRKPEVAKVEIDVRYVGFDIPNEFVVGYGLDYAEQYRNLRVVGHPEPVRHTPDADPGAEPDRRGYFCRCAATSGGSTPVAQRAGDARCAGVDRPWSSHTMRVPGPTARGAGRNRSLRLHVHLRE